jgi:hypothetical protein
MTTGLENIYWVYSAASTFHRTGSGLSSSSSLAAGSNSDGLTSRYYPTEYTHAFDRSLAGERPTTASARTGAATCNRPISGPPQPGPFLIRMKRPQ